MKFNKIFGGYHTGINGIGYFIEKQIEYIADNENENYSQDINNLSEREYEELVRNIQDDIFSDTDLWETFNNAVKYYIDQQFKYKK